MIKKIIYCVLYPTNFFVWWISFIFFIKATEVNNELIIWIPFAFVGTLLGMFLSLSYWDRFLHWLLCTNKGVNHE